MADVHIVPLPEAYKGHPRRFRPMHPPIFVHGTGEITDADRALAEELIAALDPESRAWYGRP